MKEYHAIKDGQKIETFDDSDEADDFADGHEGVRIVDEEFPPYEFTVEFYVEEQHIPTSERVTVTQEDMDAETTDDPQEVAVVKAAEQSHLTHAETRSITS